VQLYRRFTKGIETHFLFHCPCVLSDFNFFPILVTQRLLSFYLYFSASFDTSLITWLWYVKNPDTVTVVCQHAMSWPAVFHQNATRRGGPASERPPYLTYTQWYFQVWILRQTVSVPYSCIKVDTYNFVLCPSQWSILLFHLVIVVSYFYPSSVKSDHACIFFWAVGIPGKHGHSESERDVYTVCWYTQNTEITTCMYASQDTMKTYRVPPTDTTWLWKRK